MTIQNKTTQSTHTPGPWQVQIVHAPFTQYEIVHSDGTLKSLIGCTFKQGAICPEHGGDDFSNAKLLASAPELLEACKRALEHSAIDPQSELYNGIAGVIARAEGRDS